MNGSSGLGSPKLFATFDRDTSSWKMSPVTGPKGSRKSSATWPKHGMMLAGQAFELAMSEHRTGGNVSLSLLQPNTGTVRLLPTPTTSDANGPGAHGTGGKDLRTTIRLLPTPTERDYKGLANPPGRERDGRPRTRGDDSLPDAVRHTDWGVYEPAISRWEPLIGRSAPVPTVPGRHGKPVLSPHLTEWMMGVPEGWVTDIPGLSRSKQLSLLGNGVVPQQALLALSLLDPK